MIEDLKPIIKGAVKRNYSAGATVLYQGEVPRSACVITKGIVRVYGISSQGDEQIVTYHVSGELFPTSWIFNKTSGSQFFYDTVTDSEIVFIPREELTGFIKTAPALQEKILDYMVSNYTASLVRISALEQPKAREKLLYTIYYLCQRYGRPSGSLVKISLSLTHQNLASLVGLTRETTATEMNKLKKQKIIEYDNQTYKVRLEKLLELIGEESFRDIDITTQG